MTHLDWSRIDDYLFVKLVGDLLTRLGFVDVDYQGDGPDGGVDLFATEMVPFAIQGRKPFRWAVQCKFSADGTLSSVNDREVRDVEGVLRSERYLAQDVRGYLLVTNRRIVQNVIDRLRGIDRMSQFRTARLDGATFQTMLDDHPEVMNRYFDHRRPPGLERLPQLLVSPLSTGLSGKRVAQVTLEVQSRNDEEVRCAKSFGVIDTGSQLTIIPKSVARQLNAAVVDAITVAAWGAIVELTRVRVDIVIERLRFENQLVAISETDHDFAIVGMDLLRGLTVVVEGDGTLALFAE